MPQPEKTVVDYTQFFREAHSCLGKTDYHLRRGLSPEIAERFQLGYCEDWVHPHRPMDIPKPHLIIPIDRQTYLARNIQEEAKVRYGRTGHGLFHLEALKSERPVYVVEGEIDAMSIIEVGGEAVSFCGLGGEKRFLEYLADNLPATILIIALDNESTPSLQFSLQRLKEGLNRLGVPFLLYNPYGACKDANEALVYDRKAFSLAIAEGERLATRGC